MKVAHDSFVHMAHLINRVVDALFWRPKKNEKRAKKKMEKGKREMLLVTFTFTQ